MHKITTHEGKPRAPPKESLDSVQCSAAGMTKPSMDLLPAPSRHVPDKHGKVNDNKAQEDNWPFYFRCPGRGAFDLRLSSELAQLTISSLGAVASNGFLQVVFNRGRVV